MTLTPDEVDTIQDEHSAARAWLELEHERGNPNLPASRASSNQAATAKLTQAWPGAKGLAAVASEQDLGGLSPQLKRTRDAHRKSTGVSSQQARMQRRGRSRPSPTGRPAAPRPTASSSSRRGSRRGSSPSASDAADWAAPVGLSYAQMAWQVFGWGIGLSVLYLFLTKGTGAVESISRGITNTVSVIVDPLADPLSPRPAAAAAAPAAAAGSSPATPGAVLAGTQKALGGFPATRVTTTTGATTP